MFVQRTGILMTAILQSLQKRQSSALKRYQLLAGAQFIDTEAVLKVMPTTIQLRIEGWRAVHKYQSRRSQAKVAIRTPEEEALTPDVSHT